MADKIIFQLQDLRKHYGQDEILKGITLAFLEGANRANTIFLTHPPARVWIFSERITFYMKDAERAGSGTTAYAWFVWDKAAPPGTELRWLKPGYKAKSR